MFAIASVDLKIASEMHQPGETAAETIYKFFLQSNKHLQSIIESRGERMNRIIEFMLVLYVLLA